jgi:5'-deoxynucleotidase YfbR-like HD superfamily hydrolase
VAITQVQAVNLLTGCDKVVMDLMIIRVARPTTYDKHILTTAIHCHLVSAIRHAGMQVQIC